MAKNPGSKIPQITFLALVAILIVLSFLIVKPFLIAIISGALLAFVFYPLYKILLKKLKKKSLCSLITVILILLFIAVPFVLIGNTLAKETAGMFITLNEKLTAGEIFAEECVEDNFVCRTSTKVRTALENPETRTQVISFANTAVGFIAEKIGLFLMSIPGMIISLAIALFTTFYFIRDGEKFVALLKKIAPMKLIHQEALQKQLKETIRALIYGTIVVAIIQGVLAMIGFTIFGVPNAILWGVLTIFFATIPFIGAWIIWFPASIYLAITGYVLNQTSMIWKGVGLAIFGLVIISQIDNLLKPILIGGKAKIHPILIFVGVIGGLMLFGFMGIILGPIILAILQKVIEIYAKEMEPHIKEQPGILGKYKRKKKKRK